MFSYCPTVYITPKPKNGIQNDKFQTSYAKNGTITSHLIIPNGCPDTAKHMNGQVVTGRLPVLGSGYEIVEPPEILGSWRPKMGPTPDSHKAKTAVRFNSRVTTIENSGDDPLRSAPDRQGTRDQKPPKLLRSQSTQTDLVVHSEASITLNRSPSAPSPETCCHPEQPVLRSRGPFAGASWSARTRKSLQSSISSSSSTDGHPESDLDSSFSVVSTVTNPAEEIPLSVILVGDSGTGKTCLVARLAENVFMENYDVTVGIDFNVARLKLPDGRPVRLQLWDTAGQEKYRAITSSYYRKAMGVVLVYDVTRKESLENIMQVWRHEVEKYAESDVVVMLVGNKMDLDDYRTITTRVGAKVAAQLGATFFEVSAKENLNIQAAFQSFSEVVADNVYSQRNPCISLNAVHLYQNNHDRNDNLKKNGKCTC